MSIAGPNYTQVPHALLDDVLPEIDTLAELKVAMVIVRATFGWQKQDEVLSLSRLEQLTGMRRESVVIGLRKAVARGYIRKVAVGRGFAYGLVVDGVVRVRGADQGGGSADRTIDSPQTGPSDSPQTGPQLKKEVKKPSGGKKSAWPSTIDGVRVTADEGATAQLILGHWNEIFEQSLSARSWLEKILRRMREHSELTAEDHRRIIDAVHGGDHWWRGEPDPRIIYGSDGQFESCMARRRSAVSVHSEGDKGPAPARSDWNATVNRAK